MKHIWTEADDITALYVYLYGVDNIKYSKKHVAERLRISTGSFRMRIQNYQAIEGKGGLSNYSKQSGSTYKRYGKFSEKELRDLAFPELK